jgi:hypothetical protein
LARCGDDGAVIVEQPVREKALLQIKPDALDGVQFGRVGRQRDQRDVGRNGERLRAVPARLVEDHRHMLVRGDSFGKAVEEHLHRCCIGIGQHQRKAIIRARLNGSEDIGEGEALVAEARRALAPFPPDMADAPLLADPGLVLEEQAKALAFMRTLKFFQKLRGSF